MIQQKDEYNEWLNEQDCIDMQIDMELDCMKEHGWSKPKLMDEIVKIPNRLDQLRYLRTQRYGKEKLIDGLYLRC